MKYFSIFAFLMLSINTLAQDVDYYEDYTGARLEDRAYRKNIKTVRLRPLHDEYAPPIIRLNSSDKLLLEFDELYEDYKYYNYTLIHCNADWTPSDLLKSQYIEGFQEYLMDEYEYSMNTFVPYTHYNLTLPNTNMRFTKSGNYVLLIYENDPNEPLLTRRFMVQEGIVSIQASVNRATYLDYRFTHQEIDFVINNGSYVIPNPYTDLHVTILQNYNWQKGIFDLKPRFVNNGQIDYNYDFENAMKGGSEFRSFDSKDMRQNTMGIQRVALDSIYTAYLAPERIRALEKYSFDNDINGRYVVRKLDRDGATEADYVWMDFFLLAETPFTEGDVHVNGAFCDWQATQDNRLQYDFDKKAYRGQVLMKQGYYNYQYVIKKQNGELDESPIEGSYWETNNEYMILVYHREIGIRYDRLIGAMILNNRL